MQSDLNRLYEWLCINSLRLNVNKTKIILFNNEGLTPTVLLEINGEKINNVWDFKFLGVYFDHTLSFEKHFSELYVKLLRSQFIIRKLPKLLPLSCLRTLYFAYFQSNLTYCLIAWFPLLRKSCQNSLYVLQKRTIRAIYQVNPRVHCMPLFRKSGIVAVHDHCKIENCKFVHRVNGESCPKSIVNLFEWSGVKCKMWSRSLNISVHQSSKYNNSFLCRSVTDWSKVKAEYKLIDSNTSFAKRLKKDVLNTY